MSDLHIEYMPLDQLKVAPRNPKRHTVDGVSASISRFGYVESIVLDERTGCIVAGHGRRESLLKMRAEGQAPPEGVRESDGEWLVPVSRGWTSKSDRDAEAYLIASNRHVEQGGWDEPELLKLLQDVDLEGTGFSQDDITDLLDRYAEPPDLPGDPDEIPDEPGEADIYVQPGDLFVLGKHRILCGDATKPEDVRRLMQGRTAQLLWTDPPYNVNYQGGTSEHLRIQNDAMDDESFRGFLVAAFSAADAVLDPGACFYIAHADSEGFNFRGAVRDVGWKLAQCLIWVKDAFVMSRQDYHWRHEPLLFGWKLGAAHHALDDRTQDTVWEIARPRRSEEHPTMKPVELVVRSLQNSSSHGDVVFEPFSGSGTTIVACEQTNRAGRAIELEPKYVQVAVERWQKLTGKKAIKEASES